MNVTVIGPNLPRKLADLGMFHVHKAGCADIKRTFGRYVEDNDSTFEAATRSDVAEYFYGRTAGGFFEEGGGLDRYASYEAFLDEMTGEFHFAPCVKELS